MGERKINCFVLIGYGEKTDYPTGRKLNLDNTFTGLIKPVFDELGIECFRAKDILHSGVIDTPMYNWIFKADIVVADLSTLNPNVLYELGVRHALKPYTTIVISEDGLNKIPFDLNHLNIDPIYHHLGADIGIQEGARFKNELKKKVEHILMNPEADSPVFAFLKGLKIPEFTEEDITELKGVEEELQTLSEIITKAEDARKKTKYDKAIKLFNQALKINKGEPFIIQRLALVTYKNLNGNKLQSLNKALKILEELKPEISTDPETLGLSGAIYKRMFEETDDRNYLEKAIWFYERGFFIKQDYYNGINTAYLYTLKSSLQKEKDEATTDYTYANRIRQRVIELCNRLIASADFIAQRDKNWIYFTLAEAYLGLNNIKKMDEMVETAKKYSEGEFDIKSFEEQKKKLEKIISKYLKKWKK